MVDFHFSIQEAYKEFSILIVKWLKRLGSVKVDLSFFLERNTAIVIFFKLDWEYFDIEVVTDQNKLFRVVYWTNYDFLNFLFRV